MKPIYRETIGTKSTWELALNRGPRPIACRQRTRSCLLHESGERISEVLGRT